MTITAQAGRNTPVKLEITPAQAKRLWRLLGETTTATHDAAIREDLNHADIWSVWEQLDDALAARGTRRRRYVEEEKALAGAS